MREDESVLFDLLKKDQLSKADREPVKQGSRALLSSIKDRLAALDWFWGRSKPKRTSRSFS
ncbi:hypothetical protein [Halochromatium glycolicum]|uniref:Uncharacterized protein n=1 Tax=Halochromatium glycolicum TaxID=85075 RepID=A0AAJ0XAM8_9GAMM|nr:hypothetical protein [Halochromatium glycolicum]MBK1705994.1 hypothetical protein [Halochromatium glycolicum]